MQQTPSGDRVNLPRLSPRSEAFVLLGLAKSDPTTDLSVCADVLRDVIAATNAHDQDWRVDFKPRRGDKSIALALWGSDEAEPVFGTGFFTVAETLAFCERVLASDCDLNQHVVRVACEQAFSAAEVA